MKTFLKLTAVAAMLAIGLSAMAAVPISGNAPLFDSSLPSVKTNNVIVNQQWPYGIINGASAVTITNLTLITVPAGTKEVALQFNAYGTNASTAGITWVIWAGVPGGTPTNPQGTNAYGVVTMATPFAYVTNVLTGAGSLAPTIATFTAAPQAASANQSAYVGIAGIPSLYVGAVTMPAWTGITNYTCNVNVR